MNAGAILECLKASGLHIRAEGGNLRVGPKEAVTPETLELIREHKAELLEAVGRGEHAEVRHWRWIFHYPDGTQTEYRILPEPTLSELRARYPNVSSFTPLAETVQ